MKASLIARCFVIALAIAASAVACSSNALGPQDTVPQGSRLNSHGKLREHPKILPSGYITHVVVIVQENRSLNTIFEGFPGANTVSSGQESDGTVVQLTSVSLKNTQDIEHYHKDAKMAYNGGLMNGFNNERLPNGSPAGTFPYQYVDKNQTTPYWDIANSWVLDDNFFPTEFGPSFTAHLNLIAGTTEINTNGPAIVNFPSNLGQGPWGCDAAPGTTTSLLQPNGNVVINGGPFPCFTQFHTMADIMDPNVSWRYYAPKPSQWQGGGIWSAFDAISNVRNGPDWANVISPPQRILTDINNGTLANVTWVIPDFKNSDHAGSGSDSGPSWVANVVNKVGQSKFWKTSAIVVLWDDWGGWYDETPPPQLDFRGLGIRTPMLIISPYAKAGQGGGGYISHYQFEPGSILKFIENAFNLPSLASKYGSSFGYTDDRATGIGVAFDFTQTPRPFGTPIPTLYNESYFLNQTAAVAPPDDDDQLGE